MADSEIQKQTCPKCGSEMEHHVIDTTPGVSDIPDEFWRCPKCGYEE